MIFGRWTSFVALGWAVACHGSTSDEPDTRPAGGKGGVGGSLPGAGASGKAGAGTSNTGGSGGATGASDGGSGGNAVTAGAGGANAGRGGAAGTGASGGSGGESVEPAGAGGEAGSAASCTTLTTTKQHALRARSAGFSGTEAQYDEIYDLDCQVTPDCQSACMDRGGTAEMCSDTICEMSSRNYCLPTPIWTGLDALAAEDSDAAEIVLWSYPYHDSLLLDQFKLEVPDGAEVQGITATIRRAAGGDDEAVDVGVHLIKHGIVGSADRSLATPWTAPDLVDVDYGGPKDLWGDTWSADDLDADDFGVALAAGYTQTAGSGRGYVDIVYVTVTYRTCP